MLIAAKVEAEALLCSTLDGLSARVAVLDGTGTIVTVNEAWRTFARVMGCAEENEVGSNYLISCGSHASRLQEAATAVAGLREVMAGQLSMFSLEHQCTCPDGARWFQSRITRQEPQGQLRIVVAHEDITAAKQAQAELAHLTARIVRLREEERRALARELHDTTAQNLLAVTLRV